MRARRGDARAYESLVEEHQAIAFRTAYLITGSAAEAEEAAQEAFVRAWLALRRFRRGAEFRPWLLAIVANEARNRVRSRRRREGLAERAAHELSLAGARGRGPGGQRRPSARRARRPARARPQRDRLPLRARSGRAGDGGSARRRARNRQVAHRPRTRSAARRAWRSRHDAGARPPRPRRGFPETPALAAARARGDRSGRARGAAPPAPPAVLALALLLLVPATALAVSRDLRDRVLETFGLRDVKHRRAVTALPSSASDARRAASSARGSRWHARAGSGCAS